ncbi:unnamed protein product [Parnassius apollo]|uniref:(apollo) hypothetical protein n=1 Tax=Parnassius apollo TaxID=110799 RepID=A0A8S3XFW6_PARAO|nr:unnamed protein product [Parnassius apollo]
MLVTYLEASRDLCKTDSIIFGAALAVCRITGAKVSTAGRVTGQSSAIPAWRRRIAERIAKARAPIGRLKCFRSGNNRLRIVSTIRMALCWDKCQFVPAGYNAKTDGAERSRESLLGESGFGDIPRGRLGSTSIVSSRVIRRGSMNH